MGFSSTMLGSGDDCVLLLLLLLLLRAPRMYSSYSSGDVCWNLSSSEPRVAQPSMLTGMRRGEAESFSSSEGLLGVQWAAEGVCRDGNESVFETILHWQWVRWVRVGAARVEGSCDEKRTRVVSRPAERLMDSMLEDDFSCCDEWNGIKK